MNKIKLINGDCNTELSKLNIDFNKVIIVTDPPFNIGYHYNSYKDKMKESEYYTMLLNILKGKKHVLIHYSEQMHKHSISIKEAPFKTVSWVYNSNTGKQHREIGFYGFNPIFKQVGQPYKNPNDKRIKKRIEDGKMAKLYDWWNVNQVKNVSKEKTEHPCQMPLEVMKNIIGILPKGYIVIDPFMGSGTTGLACKELGVDFIGIEIDKKYFDIANNRINYENK